MAEHFQWKQKCQHMIIKVRIPPIKRDFYRTLRTIRGYQYLDLNCSEEGHVYYHE